MSRPIKEGFMEKRYHKGRVGKQWTRRWVLLYDISESGVPRLETYDSEEQAMKDTSKGMIIALNNDVHKIVSSQVPKRDFTIDIVMGQDKVHTFAVESKAEQNQWLELMQRVANLGKRTSMQTPPTNRYNSHDPHRSLESQLSTSSTDSFHAEENTVYDSYDVKQYNVRIQDNDFTRSQLKLHGRYILCLDSLKLTLVHPEKGNMLYAWPYKYLRRYGRDKTSFSIEAGRKCQSGPGLIVFETTEGNTIFHEIQNFVSSLSTSQPLNAAQKVKQDHHNTHGSHEDLSSKVKQMSTMDDILSRQPRSHSFTSSAPVTQSQEFKDRIAQRKVERYTDQTISGKTTASGKPVVSGKPTIPNARLPLSAPAADQQIYSEVSDQNASKDQPRMPVQEPYDGEYDIAGDMGPSGHHGPPPPDSDEYDELSSALYTNPTDRQNGDAWKKYALPSDNIHTETYMSGPNLHSGARNKNKTQSPKGKPRHDLGKAVKQPEESVYSIATGPTPTANVSPPLHQAGDEVYDHLNRQDKIAKPKPVPRKPGLPLSTVPTPSKPVPRSPVQHEEATIYDHLDRQQPNTGKPSKAPKAKPKPSVRRPSPKVGSNATYGTLYQEEKEEESAYGHLQGSSQKPLNEDQAGYLTRSQVATYPQDLPNDEDYDELNNFDRGDQFHQNEESLYDLPES